MAAVLDRPRAARRWGGVLRALVAGVGAALGGLAVVTTVVLVGWGTRGIEPSGSGDASVLDAVRVAGLGWLAAHHVPLVLPTGVLAWLPLGLLIVPGASALLAGHWVARRSSATGRRQIATEIAAMTLTYAAFAAGVAVVASSPQVSAAPAVSASVAAILAAVAGSIGARRPGDPGSWLWRRLPVGVRACVAGGVAGVGVLVGGGALVVATALAVNRHAVGELVSTYDAGPMGSTLLILLSAAYVPNIVIWAVAYAIGPGFAVGAGTSVSPLGVEVGALPTLALLGALPPPGEAPMPSLLALLVPVVAGVIVGRMLGRHSALRNWAIPLWACAAAGVAGLMLGALAVLAGGPLGGGRLAVLGPSPWAVAVAATIELGAIAAPTAWLTARRLRGA